MRRSREKCWDEMLSSLNTDPWGRPYKIVLKRHRAPVTESLKPQLLGGIVDTRFPRRVEGSTLEWGPDLDGSHELTEEQLVSGDELTRAVRRIGSRKAPGPDDIPGRILVRALDFLGARLKHIFNKCLRQGQFPQQWKKAKLVLLPKASREAGTPSAYRPICLLDEVGKIFEKILATRLVQHLSRNGDLHEEQYGFREGRSTIDVIKRVRSLAEGRVAVAISLDIKNAFNTLRERGSPLPRGSHQRVFPGPGFRIYRPRIYGRRHSRSIHCGVPQGSVLGPLLWDLAYDQVLCLPHPCSCHTICYADDTLVVAVGDSWRDAAARTDIAVARVVRGITDMGVQVAVQKTEAIYFYGKASGKPPLTHIVVRGTSILVGDRIKYLGTFGHHFDALAPRVERVAAALAGLLPNLGDPDGRMRRMYMATVNSVALYGALVWAADLAVS